MIRLNTNIAVAHPIPDERLVVVFRPSRPVRPDDDRKYVGVLGKADSQLQVLPPLFITQDEVRHGLDFVGAVGGLVEIRQARPLMSPARVWVVPCVRAISTALRTPPVTTRRCESVHRVVRRSARTPRAGFRCRRRVRQAAGIPPWSTGCRRWCLATEKVSLNRIVFCLAPRGPRQATWLSHIVVNASQRLTTNISA